MNNQEISPEPRESIQTQHAMLVIWGVFAKELGLVERIQKVKLRQKTRDHTPQKKVLEFFVSQLAGCERLKDISLSAHPLDKDTIVAEAWGQSSWADYSGVSRTLNSLSEEESQKLVKAVNEVEQPYIEQEIALAQSVQGCLIYDADLTGRPVSSTSSSYPETAFGYMGDSIELGYQAALVSMHSPTYGRLWLSNQLHPGDTVSATEAKALVLAAEVRTRVRPWRRTTLAAERLESAEAELVKLQNKASESEDLYRIAESQLRDTHLLLQESKFLLSSYEQEYQQEGRNPTQYCKLTRTKRKIETYQGRLPRCQKKFEVAQRRLERNLAQYQHALVWVEQYRTQYEHFVLDNQKNPYPVRVIIRIDAGFASQDNINWLIEMGYDIFTKDRGSKARNFLTGTLPADAHWQEVGRNASMVTCPSTTLNGHFTYPLNVALLRYRTGDSVRHSILLHYGEDDVNNDPHRWFHTYNARQTIEAGIKEGKSVFQMHHLKVRSSHALCLQEHLASFAANFVRFAAQWLTQQQCDSIPFDTQSVKQMVRVCAHTSAWVSRNGDTWLLMFTDHSLFAGHLLRIGSGPIQLPLPLPYNFYF